MLPSETRPWVLSSTDRDFCRRIWSIEMLSGPSHPSCLAFLPRSLYTFYVSYYPSSGAGGGKISRYPSPSQKASVGVRSSAFLRLTPLSTTDGIRRTSRLLNLPSPVTRVCLRLSPGLPARDAVIQQLMKPRACSFPSIMALDRYPRLVRRGFCSGGLEA